MLTKMKENEVNVDVTVRWLALPRRRILLAARTSFMDMVASLDDRISGCSMARRL